MARIKIKSRSKGKKPDPAPSINKAKEDGKIYKFSPQVVGQKNDYATFASIKEKICLLYTSPSPRDGATSRMPSSA